jgi:methylmalonyl-CoA mutase
MAAIYWKCIPAVRARATVGEISDVLEKSFGRYVATTQCISGVYASEYGDSEIIESIRKRTESFKESEGRRPRILVTKMGQDGHEEAARMAVENDVHVVGVSSLAAGHNTLVPELIAALRKEGGEDILVVVGGIIPPSDYESLYKAGVVGIYGPGTPVTESANKVLKALEQK